MKQQVLCIHGGQAYSRYEAFIADLRSFTIDPFEEKRRWRTNLPAALGEDFEVFLPEMPNKMNAKYLEWKIWFSKYLPYLRDGICLIGHSLGGYFLAKYLSEEIFPVAIARLYLISVPFENSTAEGEDGGDFGFKPEHFATAAQRIGEVSIFHAQDDPVVPFVHARHYAELLPHAHTYFPHMGGHFLQPEFPELLKAIKER